MQPLSRKNSGPLNFQLAEREIFVSVWSAKGDAGDAHVFPIATFTRFAFEKWLKSVSASANKADLELKIVGNKSTAAKCAVVFKEMGLAAKGTWAKDFSKLDIKFFPDTGRLQVAEAVVIAAAPVKSTRTRVLIVDDSATIRKLLTTLLSADPSLEIVGVAEKPSQVQALIEKTKPDVITLDIHMPEMTGVELLRRILPRYRIPTVMISSISMEESPMVLEALEIGAVDYIQKPAFNNIAVAAPLIIEKVKAAAGAKIKRNGDDYRPPVVDQAMRQDRLVAIGSSTGGTEALRELLIRLPAGIPPILIVQHIPPIFSLAFANRLNDLCPFEVKEAAHGDEVRPGRVLIAPGGLQMKLVRQGGNLVVAVEEGPPVNRHKPSVDFLFHSVAAEMAKKSIGVILTGMGADGAKGMLEMRKNGSRTIAQDEESCVVFGMPREAIACGAAEETKSLFDIPALLLQWLKP